MEIGTFFIVIMLFSIPGVILFYSGIKILLKNKHIKKNGIKTTAVIIDIVKYTDRSSHDSGTNISTYPIIEFMSIDKERITSKLKEGKGNYLIGDKVGVIYLKNEDKYDIITNENLWRIKFPLGMIVVGFIILLVIALTIIYRI
ncbi:MAG: hypothetical protein ACK5MZ_05480 [Aestuariibaculum sp.]